MARCILSYVNLANYIQFSKFPHPNLSRDCRFRHIHAQCQHPPCRGSATHLCSRDRQAPHPSLLSLGFLRIQTSGRQSLKTHRHRASRCGLDILNYYVECDYHNYLICLTNLLTKYQNKLVSIGNGKVTNGK